MNSLYKIIIIGTAVLIIIPAIKAPTVSKEEPVTAPPLPKPPIYPGHPRAAAAAARHDLEATDADTEPTYWWQNPTLSSLSEHLQHLFSPRHEESKIRGKEYSALVNNFTRTIKKTCHKDTWCVPHAKKYDDQPKIISFLSDTFFELKNKEPRQESYVQKINIPNKPSIKILVMGDLHGSYSSLKKNLESMKKLLYINEGLQLANQKALVFTGDYGDRGDESVEVWYTIMLLKIINPFNVFLLRGNHETAPLASRYGLDKEIVRKLSKSFVDIFHILFDLLPLALFTGFSHSESHKQTYLLFTHGGIEEGFHPSVFLSWESTIGIYNQKIVDFFYPELLVTQSLPTLTRNNFLWGDFCEGESTKPSERRFKEQRIPILNIGIEKVPRILHEKYSGETYETVAIGRAHQHNNLPVGIGMTSHIDPETGELYEEPLPAEPSMVAPGSVYTFMSCETAFSREPDLNIEPSGYGVFTIENNAWKLENIVNTHRDAYSHDPAAKPKPMIRKLFDPRAETPQEQLQSEEKSLDEILEEAEEEEEEVADI
jgi:hypothetical protein